MSVESETRPVLDRRRITPGQAGRAGVTAAVVALGLNLVALAIGAAADATMLVTQPGATEPMSVGNAAVAATTVASVAIGTAVLALAARRGARAWRAAAWLGLAIGIVTVAMPLSVEASGGTRMTLASMHVISGVVWFVTLWFTDARRGSPA